MKFKASNIGKSIKSFTKKHGSDILIGLGIISGGTAIVTAVKATPKAVILLEEREEELETDKLDFIETVKTAWRCYIPTAVAEAFSIAFLICAATNNNKHTAALSTAYALSENAFREYRNKIVDTIGEKKEKEVRDEIAKDRIRENPPTSSEAIVSSSGDQLCFDSLSARYFHSNSEKIRRAVNKVNDDMIRSYDGSATLNDLYYEIGLPETKLGEELGWENMKTGLIDIQFSVQLSTDEIPCLVIDFGSNPPTYFDLH